MVRKALLIVIGAILLIPALSQADFDYMSRAVTFSLGADPTAVAIGDINGDGRSDAVVAACQRAAYGRQGLFVFRQDGSGFLQAPVNYPDHPYNTVAIGDINGDGRQDIVTGYGVDDGGGSQIDVFLQDQSGNLGPAVSYPTPNSYIVKVIDVNGDGRVDVVGLGGYHDAAPQPLTTGISIFYQNAQGTLDPAISYPIDAGPGYLSLILEAGDIDNDGRVDFVTQYRDASGTYHLVARLQNQDGTFGDPIYYTLGTDETFGFTIRDIDGDGNNELIVGVRENLLVFHHVTLSDFGQPDSVALGITGISGLVAKDMNGDGRNDLVFLCNPDVIAGVCISYQSAAGALSGPTYYYPVGYSQSAPFPTTYRSGGPLSLGDLNGDGLPDVIFPSEIFGLVVDYHTPLTPVIYPSPTPLSFTSAGSQTVQVSNYGAAHLMIGPMSVTGNDRASFSIESDGCSQQSLPPYTYCTVRIRYEPSSGGAKVAHLQIPSNDPLRSQATVPLNGSIASHDLFEPYACVSTSDGQNRLLETLAIGDLNGDGKNDVALLSFNRLEPSDTDRAFVYIQNSSGHLLPSVSYWTSQQGTRASGIGIGDVTGNGKQDLVVGNGVGIEIFRQNVSGTLDAPVAYATQNSLSIKIADFNKDGRMDVLGVGWGFDGNIVNYENVELFPQTSGSLGSSLTYYAPYAGRNQVITIDINGSSKPGVLVRSGQLSCPELTLIIQKADGTTILRYFLANNGTIHSVDVGDVNGDGLQDIVFTYWGIGKIGILIQKSDGTFESEINYDTYDSPQSLAIADVNGDGRNDIVIVHTGNSTQLGVFLQDEDGFLMREETYPLPYATNVDPDSVKVGDLNGDGRADVAFANYNYGLVVLYQKTATLTPTYTLTTTVHGSGTVTASGLNCGSTSCSGTYTHGATVSLLATPVNGASFMSWTGCDAQDGTTCSVLLTSSRNVTATFSGSTTTSGKPPKISVSPTSVNFAKIRKGASLTKTIRIKNTGGTPLEVGTPSIDNPQFSVTGNTCTFPVAKNLYCTMDIQFSPAAYGKTNDVMSIPSNDTRNGKSPYPVKLRGEAPPPKISAAKSVSMGSVLTTAAPATKTITVKNTGLSDLHISSITIAGDTAFSQTNTCESNPLGKGVPCSITITFGPSKVGPVAATLSIVSNDPATSTKTILLKGRGK
jgi:hypothetical protein